MQIYKVGKIVSVGKGYVIFESQYTGHIIHVANPNQFKKDENRKIYVYEYNTEYIQSVYGFANFKDRMMFEDLISVNGVGPKTALSLLKEGCEPIISLILSGDSEGLSSYPYLGGRTANQIIFELSDKYKNMSHVQTNKKLLPVSEVKNSLKTLGFTSKQIDYAVQNIKPSSNIEQLVEQAIKVISNAKFA